MVEDYLISSETKLKTVKKGKNKKAYPQKYIGGMTDISFPA